MSELTLNERQIICGKGIIPQWNEKFYSEQVVNGGVQIWCSYCENNRGIDLLRFVDYGNNKIHNGGFYIPSHMQSMGYASRILVNEVYIALKYGMSKITMIAGSNYSETGYYVWPKFGFDGPVPQFAERKVSSIINDNGEDWWKKNGKSFVGELSLDQESDSFKKFVSYVKSKGLWVDNCKLSRTERKMLCGFGVLPDWDDANYFEFNDENEILCEYRVRDANDHDAYSIVVTRAVYDDCIKNRCFYLPSELQGNGLGIKLLLQEVHIASLYKMSYISCFASDSGDDVGSIVWPKMGFDGYVFVSECGKLVSICEYEIEPCPKDCVKMLVSEYIQLFGYGCWRTYGSGFNGTFDLKPESYSMRTLYNYAQNKGVL